MPNVPLTARKPATGTFPGSKVGTMALPVVGDTVDVHWGDGRHNAGIVEQFFVGTVKVRIPGRPEITIVAAAQLAERGAKRWRLNL